MGTFDEMKAELHDIYLITIGMELEKIGRPDPKDPKTRILGHAAMAVLKLRDERDELKLLAHAFQLAKLDEVWRDEKYAWAHPSKSGWKIRYNQPDIFLFETRPEHGGPNAILFEKNGRWVAGTQGYPMPFITDQTEHTRVGDAVVAALKAAEWEGGSP